MLWSIGKVQTHQFQPARQLLKACLLFCLVYGALGANAALAGSPPPPEPSPDPIIPKIDPKPETPDLSIGLTGTDIKLSWNATQDAEYYPVYAYTGGQWRHMENISGTRATYDHEQRGWDISELQFKILACKAKDWYVAMWAWEWGDDKRCSDYSNSVQLPLVDAIFSLSSHSLNLNSVNINGVKPNPISTEQPDSPADPVDPADAIRYIVATLRLTDRDSGDVQDIRWPIDLNTDNFSVTSNKTILVTPGIYNVEFLAIDGTVTYLARALNVTLSETQQTIPLELKTVLGDSHVTIDTVISLPEFQFQYDPTELSGFTQPKIGVVIDGGGEVLLTLNPETGITDQYLSINEGQHTIQLKFYDGVLLKGRSRPEHENPVIVRGQPFAMDLIPLYGETTLSLNTAESEATFNFAIPTVAIEEVGGNPDNLQVVLSMTGVNNQPSDVLLSHLTYNPTSDVYEAQHTYTGMQADSQMTLSLTFTDLSAEPDQLLGTCVVGNFMLNSSPNTIPCQLTLRRRAIIGGHLLAVLGINVFDATSIPVSGASVYAKRQGTENEDEDLGTLLGLTGSGNFGAPGYLKTYLVPGSYQLTAKYVPIDGTAQEIIALRAFNVQHQTLVLDKEINQNHPPSITLTAPAEDATADKSYSIQWIASDDGNDQASISLYYDTNSRDYDGELITQGLVEGTDTSHTWNTAAIPEGDYYLYAVISDGIHEVKAYSAQPLTIEHDHGLVVDCSSAFNNYGGQYNAPNYCSWGIMTLLNPTDGSIHAWGTSNHPGGTSAPMDTGYTKIYSNIHSGFAALKADGSITTWGSAYWGGSGAPTDTGYIKIYSTSSAFAALKANGSISVWGSVGTGAPTDNGYTKIYSTRSAFAALKADGFITAWGDPDFGGNGAPTDSGYTKIYSNNSAFAALKADGSITAWGYSGTGGTGAPTDSGYTKIYSSGIAFAALKADGSITAWGDPDFGGNGAPTDSGYTKIYSTYYAFTALKADGSITAWGDPDFGGNGAPTDSGYTKIYSTGGAFAALKADGSIFAWGRFDRGGTGAPTDSGYTKIYSTRSAFAALKADGSITAWGPSWNGGTGAPTDNGYISIYSTNYAFTAVKADGTVFSWGDSQYSGSGAPANLNDTSIQNQNQNYQLKLNDTGITWGGEYPSGNNSTCTGETITQQDCSHGRDAQARAGTLEKVGGGAAGFDLTRLNADGSDYTGNGDYSSQPWACVRDNHTGLVWEVKTDDGGIHDKDNTYRWGGKTALVNQQARDDGWGAFYDDWDTLVDGSNSANSGSGLCGFTNWRVPMFKELTGIPHKGVRGPAIDSNYFPNTISGYYWSSSLAAYNTDEAWIVNFYNGYDYSYTRSDYRFVRLVAGVAPAIAEDQSVHDYIPNNTPDDRYTPHNDGTVTDTWTELIWQRCTLGQTWDGDTCTGNASTYTWQGALQQGESNSFAGYSDWRLPNVQELRSLVAYDRYDPAINSVVFPNTSSSFYVSSSPITFQNDTAKVWLLHFLGGYDGYTRNPAANNYAVRLVRGGQ